MPLEFAVTAAMVYRQSKCLLLQGHETTALAYMYAESLPPRLLAFCQ